MLGNAITRSHDATDSNIERQESVVAVIVAVTAVEVFLNLFFRMLAEEDKYAVHKEWIVSDIDKRITLDEKLRKWPFAIFGKKLDFGSGATQSFMKLKSLRNQIVHFTSDHETVDLGGSGIIIHGVADSSKYDSLCREDAKNAQSVSWDLIREIFILSGTPSENVGSFMHVWCGMPSNKSLQPTAKGVG